MNLMETLRGIATGSLNEDALQSVQPDQTPVTDDDIAEYENDQAFMQECTADLMGLMIQGMILGESADELDEGVKNAVLTLQDYFVGQGLIDEAATVSISNPKINVVHLNKQAQIKRLSTIITLKMGRKAGHKAYKKYKLGQKIKKTNMEEMRRIYGAKAERLAKKLWQKTRKSGKVAAVVDKNTPKK
ncbi:MAG: hypothetical protein NC114_06495 [Ruminococcus flavefaciens]|nr:hypothetical protein [Ruminococcus flavefaciens]